MVIANYMAEYTDLDQVWFVVSPHNPLKDKSKLIEASDRLKMVKEAISNDPRFQVSDVEFHLPLPSYTIDTFLTLGNEFPEHTFVLVMGSDGLVDFDLWKNFNSLMSRYQRYVYPRPETPEDTIKNAPNIKLVKAPLMDISSTFIRKAMLDGKDMRHFLPEKVWEYIMRKGLYK